MAILNLNKKLSYPKRGSKLKKFLILLLIILAIYLPLRFAYSFAKQIVQSGKEISFGAKSGNLDIVKKGVVDAKTAASRLNFSLNFLFWLRFIPFLGGYYSDIWHFTKALEYEAEAGRVLVEMLEPHKVELGFTGQPIPGQDKLSQAVKMLEKVTPNIGKVEPHLKRAKNEVKDINVGKYPEGFGKYRLRHDVELAKNFIVGAHAVVTEGKDALEIAPSALGKPTKNYLLVFQNDKEIRATGGFMTAYAFLKLTEGKFSTTSSDDIYRLDEKLLRVCLSKICPLTPPTQIVKYLPEATGKERTAWSMRDANVHPDLPSSMQEFERMYKLLGEGLPFDGIILIDTKVVEELIKITGPIEVFGIKYSGNQDIRCDCPNVIYELERYAQIIEGGEQDRKAILGVLMQQLLAQSLGASLDKLPEFINTGVKLANEKHLLFYMHDDKVQKALSKLNWTGEIKKVEVDYLHINNSNFAGGKTNLYIEEKVELNIKVDSSGIKNKLTIEYKNPQSFNRWLNTIYRDYIRVYVPRGSKLISSKGSDDPVSEVDDENLDKTYFESFIQVRPQNSRILSFEYLVPLKMVDKNYKLLIQKQPGAKNHHYLIKLNNKTKATFNLTTDQQFDFSI